MPFKAGSIIGEATLNTKDWQAGTKKLTTSMVKVEKESKAVTKSFDKVGKGTKNLSDTLGKGALAFGVVAGSIYTAIRLGTKWYDLSKQQEEAEIKLEAVLKATGEAAGISSDELFKMASNLQNVTTFGDEAIIGAQGIIATFNKISGKQFERATETVLDLSVALGQDLKSSAISLGKVLQDPVKQLSALSRSGVSFSVAQELKIKALVDKGSLKDAQNIILDVISEQVGGVAEALATTDSGKITQLSNQWGDLGEQLGFSFSSGFGKIAPAITGVIGKISNRIKESREINQALFSKNTDATLEGYEEQKKKLEEIIKKNEELLEAEAKANKNKFFLFHKYSIDVEHQIDIAKEKLELVNESLIPLLQEQTNKQKNITLEKEKQERIDKKIEAIALKKLEFSEASSIINKEYLKTDIGKIELQNKENLLLRKNANLILDSVNATKEEKTQAQLVIDSLEEQIKVQKKLNSEKGISNKDEIKSLDEVGAVKTKASELDTRTHLKDLDNKEQLALAGEHISTVLQAGSELTSFLFAEEQARNDEKNNAKLEELDALATAETEKLDIKTLEEEAYTTRVAEIKLKFNNEEAKAKIKNLNKEALGKELYNKKVANIDKKYNDKKAVIEKEHKKRQNVLALKSFNAGKINAVAEVGIQTAIGIITAIATLGPILGPIASAITGVTAGISIGTILAKKFVPTYERGGTHSGGLALTDERGGELKILPDGTKIIPHDISQDIMNTIGRRPPIIINVYGNTDANLIAERVKYKLSEAL